MLTGLAGCAGKQASTPTPTPTASAALEDCDKKDRAKRETPDCGFRHGGRFYEWSWVKAGQLTPPAGWDPAAEKRRIIG